MKNKYIILLSIFLLIVSDCTPVPSPQEEESQASCERLNRLMYMIRQTDKAIHQKKEVKEIEGMVADCIALLKVQKQDTTNICRFEDHNHYPQYARFMLTDNLSGQIMRGKLAELFPYLLAFGALYDDDPEVSEYFGEKLALIAYHNPEVWVNYYNLHPEIQDSLYNHTAWKILDKSRILRRLKSVKDSEGIIDRIDAKDGL